jgi:hypothetical protein
MISFGVDMCSASSVRRSGSGESPGSADLLTMAEQAGRDREVGRRRVDYRLMKSTE